MIEQRAGYLLKRVEYLLTERMSRCLHEIGLTIPQYAALSMIEQKPGIISTDVAIRVFVSEETINPILNNLAKDELIIVQDSKNTISAKGSARLTEGHQKILQLEEALVAPLSPEERIQFVNTLQKCATALEA